MKKQLNTEAITNELREGSVFFRPQPTPPPKAKPTKKSDQPPVKITDLPAAKVRTDKRSENRTEKRTVRRSGKLPVKRGTKRYSFEFYEDQLLKIKQLVREAEDRGDRITQSVIVREAMDVYLKNK